MWNVACRVLLMLLFSSTPAWAQGKLPAWTATEVSRISGVAEDLSAINWIAVSRHGTIAIAQPQDGLVLFYSADGKRLGSFGRAGEGPGEFRGVGPLGWIGDTLWVQDHVLRRKTFISPQRTHQRDVADRPSASITVEEDLPCLRKSGGPPISNILCARTVRSMVWEGSPRVTVTQSNPTTSTASYTVSLSRSNGDPGFTRSYTTASVPIPRHYADSLIDLLARTGGPGAKAFLQGTTPTTFQPVRRVLVGTDGTIWLMYFAAPGAPNAEYLVLAANGEPLATVRLPRSVVLQVVTRRSIWGTLTDADGFYSVVRYRLQ